MAVTGKGNNQLESETLEARVEKYIERLEDMIKSGCLWQKLHSSHMEAEARSNEARNKDPDDWR